MRLLRNILKILLLMTTSVKVGALLVNSKINDTIEQNFILFGDYHSQGYGAENIADIEPFFYWKCGYIVLKMHRSDKSPSAHFFWPFSAKPIRKSGKAYWLFFLTYY